MASYYESFSQTLYFKFILLTVTLGPLLFGYHLGELNAPSEVITCHKRSIRSTSAKLPQCLPMTPLEFGLTQSIFTLGGLIGALVAGPVSSKRGRLSTMRMITIPSIMGPAVSALAPNVGLMALGRLLSGIAAGASLVVVPITISEIAPAESRGFYGSFTQIMTNVGIFITQVIGYFLSHDALWRVILGIAGIIGAVQAVSLFVAGVESPKWLLEKGNSKEARAALRRLRGTEEGIDDEIRGWKVEGTKDFDSADEERQSLLTSADTYQTPLGTTATKPTTSTGPSNDLSFLAVLLDPRYRPAIFSVILVMAAQQFTGINSIVMYGVGLLSSLLSSSSALLNIFVSLLNIIATTTFAPLSDNPRLGRKGCLLLSITGMSISSILLGIGIRASVKVLSAISVLTFVASFALGLGPVPFMLASEMVDAKGVGATQSWALAGNWIATFVVAQFFPIVNEALGKGVVYFVFAGLGLFFFLSVGWYVPETRSKQGMNEVWVGRIGSEAEQAGYRD